MQSLPEFLPQLRRDQSAGLLYPTLLQEGSLDQWLGHPDLIEQDPPWKMASHADDSSVDGTVSSVGESTWDMIDEGSVASEDGAYAARREAKTSDEGIESVHVTNRSFATIDSSRSEATEDSDADDLVPRQARDTTIDNPEPNLAMPLPQSSTDSVFTPQSSQAQELYGTIRVNETLYHCENCETTDIRMAYARVCTFDEEQAKKDLFKGNKTENVVPLEGRVHMGLKEGGLEAKDTFRLLYFGPKEMKAAITQKVGSAIAANPRRLSVEEGPGSSRVTVVPISSFVDESSPEVVMIESGGFDMIIEECVEVYRNARAGIALKLESGETMESYVEGTDLKLSTPSGIPDLTIIYTPKKTLPPKERFKHVKETVSKEFAEIRAFADRHCLPYYLITDADWLESPLAYPRDWPDRTPHRSIEALVDGKEQTWKHVPIDLTTFLALDASQLHQNLVAIRPVKPEETPEKPPPSPNVAVYSQILQEAQIAKHQCYKYLSSALGFMREAAPATWFSIIAVVLAFALLPLLASIKIGGPHSQLESTQISNRCGKASTSNSLEANAIRTEKAMQLIPTAKDLANLFAMETQYIRPGNTHQQTKGPANRAPRNDKHEQQDKVLVRVVGTSHVLIRPSKSTSGSSNLNFKTTRNGKGLEHHLQKIDTDYLVLEIPPADAYGQIDIQIWSSKPKYNETFHIDLGFPWFKVNGWKEIATDAAERSAQEAQALRDNLWKLMQQGNSKMEDIKRNEALLRTIDKFSKSLRDLEQAAHSGSDRLLKRSIRNTIRMRNKLARMMKKLQHTSTQQSNLVLEQQARLNADMNKLMQVAGKALDHQRSRAEKALRSFQSAVHSRSLHSMRERHLRRAQKQLLRAWWKVRGRPTRRP